MYEIIYICQIKWTRRIKRKRRIDKFWINSKRDYMYDDVDNIINVK